MQSSFYIQRRAPRRAASVKLVLASALLMTMAAARSLPAAAAARHAALVVDANTGAVLHAEAADEPRYPASLTKMMTLYVVFEEMEQGRLTAATRIKISQEAAAAAPTKLDLEPGEDIALGDAVKALVVKSANDIAIAVAEHISGSESKFAARMTTTAQRLGMKNTVFKNASGLPDAAQTSTARDMVTLALRLNEDFPRHYPLFATRTFQHGGNTYRSHNTLLSGFEGADGIKTGYTRMSGFNLVSSVRRGDKRIVGAVFGGSSAGTRNATMRQILTRSLLKASTTRTRKPAPILVARPKPAPKLETKAVAAVAPAPMALPASAIIAPTVPPTVKPAPVDAAPPPPAPVPPAIEIARVRPVMVVPRVRPVAFAMAGAEGAAPPVIAAEPARAESIPRLPEPSPASASPPPPRIETEDADRLAALAGAGDASRLASWAAAALTERPANLSSVVPPPPAALQSTPAGLVSQPPSAFERRVASAIAKVGPDAGTTEAAETSSTVPVPPTRRDETPARVEPLASAPAARQAPPGSRGIAVPPQQAAAVPAGPAPGSAGPQAPPAGGGFQVQIGAYSTLAEAARNLSATREKAAAWLNGHAPVTLPVARENRQLYRARFAGFDARTAASTCLELRKKQIDCFVMKAE